MATQQTVKIGYRLGLCFCEIVTIWVYLSYLVCKWSKLDIDYAIFMTVMGVLLSALICYCSYTARILFAILFSGFWAYLVLEFVSAIPGTTINPWAAFWVVFTVILVLHKVILQKNPLNRSSQ